jgi:hypothetical protein
VDAVWHADVAAGRSDTGELADVVRDEVCLKGSAIARYGQPTGKTWKATCNAHYRVANGKIVDFWVNWDWLSIMQQLGAVTGP